ncbi:hypothetical protein AB205_0198250 [Aquarana catesbeiana]|uniref:Secreted protein n=1 Tax=Aquarana catesbeiana TaxID=8400 RepID=A0A2G9RYF1_AQUCT|nr:hypothetical protein AB205_0198250 [Aquarana catesbeiana]
MPSIVNICMLAAVFIFASFSMDGFPFTAMDLIASPSNIAPFFHPPDIPVSGGSALCTVRISTWSVQRLWISWTNCCDTITRHD